MALKFLNDGYFAGKVGIGIQSPAAKLHVNPTTTDEIAIAINGTQNYSAGEFQRIAAGDASSINRLSIGFGYDNPTDWAIRYSSYGRHEFYTGNDWGNAANTEKMVITSSGNVGIGTGSPGYKLSVDDNSVTNIPKTLLQFDAASIADNGGYNIDFRASSNDLANRYVARIRGIRESSGALSQLSFWTESGSALEQRMTIRASGNVGIGTTSPLKKLSINGGDVAVNNGNSFIVGAAITGNSQIGELGADSGQLQLLTESTRDIKFGSTTYGNIMFLEGTNGNVGIGTTSPAKQLVVRGSAPWIRIEENSASNKRLDLWVDPTSAIGYIGANQSAQQLSFQTAGSDRIRILNNGNVGIGTTNPGYKLDVAGDIRVDSTSVAQIFLDSAASNDAVLNFHENASQKGKIGYDTSLAGIALVAGSGAFSTADMVLLDGGNVGIGTTSPVRELEVQGGGNVYIRVTASTDNDSSALELKNTQETWTIRNEDTNADALHFNSDGGTKMVIETGGNVGIGTTSPAAPLHVLDDSSANVLAKIRIQGDSTSGYGDIGMQSGYIRLFSNGSMCSAWTGGVQYSYINGSTATTLTSTGLGIGTTSPSQKLHVAGNARVTGAYYDSNNSPGTANQVLVSTVTGTDWVDGSGSSIIGGPYLPLTAGSSYPLTGVLYLGNVASDQKIQFQRTGGNVYSIEHDSAKLYFYNRTTTESPLIIQNDGDVLMNAGNVGIGTTSPNRSLHVIGQVAIDNSTSPSGGLLVSPDGTSNKVYSRTGNATSSAHPLDFISGSSTSMRITSAGNVGIGTTAPSQKLHISGNMRLTGAFRDRLNSQGAANYVLTSTGSNGTQWVDASGSSIIGGPYLPLAGGTMTGTAGVLMPDNFRLKIGTSEDLLIFHDGTDSQIFNQIGDLKIRNDQNDGDIVFMSDNGSGGTTEYFTINGTVERNIFYKDTKHPDGVVAHFGNGDDLQIYHDGSNSYIDDAGTGSLFIRASAAINLTNPSGSENIARFIENDRVELYFNGVKKFETTSTGVTVTGDVQIDSALLSNQENTDVDTGTETVANVAIATYTAAFFDFVIKKTTNVRSGTVYACHDGTNVEFTETSTQDLGDTSDVTLSVDISGGNMRLQATTTSDDWSIKSLIRAI